MPATGVMDGAVVPLWLRLAADALDRARPAIDLLNVFPVADSDTGTNLHRTIASAQQLDVLAASGVVDASGAGLCVVLDALNTAISGTQPGAFAVPEPAAARGAGAASAAASPFSYEVTFLLDAAQEAVAALWDRLDALGDSLVVSGRDAQWHVHVGDAGAVIEGALAAGQLSKITITYLNQTQASIPAGQSAPPSRVVAVAEGPGLTGLLRAAGATAVDLQPGIDPGVVLDELAMSPGPAVMLAPAGFVAGRWPPGWPVLEVECLIQSLAALAVHEPGRDQDADLGAMRTAVAGMRWASLSLAQDAMPARRPDTWLLVGRVAGQVAVCGADQAAVAIALSEQLLAADPEMITLVTGRAAEPELGAAVAGQVAARAPGVEVVCYDGGMTSAVLLIGAE